MRKIPPKLSGPNVQGDQYLVQWRLVGFAKSPVELGKWRCETDAFKEKMDFNRQPFEEEDFYLDEL